MSVPVRLDELSAQALASQVMQSLTGGLTPADFEDSAARGGIHRCVLAGGDLVGFVNVTWNRELIVGNVSSHRRRGGLRPYRHRRQHQQTVMVRVSERFLDETLWPQFEAIDRELHGFLHDVTNRVIREAARDLVVAEAAGGDRGRPARGGGESARCRSAHPARR